MNRPVLYEITLAAVLCFTTGFVLGHHVGRKETQPPAIVKVEHQETQHAESLAKQIDTVVQVRTKTLTKTVTEYQPVRDTVIQRLTDTVVVKQFIHACDSIVGACNAFRESAFQKFHADSEVLRAKDRELAAWQAAQPTLWHKAKVGLGWAVVGALTLRAVQLRH